MHCSVVVPGGVSHEQLEGVFGGGAEVLPVDGRHDVGVAVDELHEALEAPKEATAAARDALDHRVVLAVLLQLLLDVLDHDADHPDRRYDQGAEGEGAQVVAKRPAISKKQSTQPV